MATTATWFKVEFTQKIKCKTSLPLKSQSDEEMKRKVEQ